MYKTLTALQFRSQFSECLTQTWRTGDRFLIVRHGRDVAALVSVEDMDLLEDVEGKSLSYKRFQIEEAQRRWEALKAGLDG